MDFGFIKKKDRLDASQGFMQQRRQVLSDKTDFTVREAYKTLRANLLFTLAGNKRKVICMTSSLSGEGKSITALNLAISLAEANNRVLLIDGDMRRPALGRLLIEKSSPGLSNVLASLNTFESCVRRDMYPNLDVLLAGDVPPNPSELLGSLAMKELLFLTRTMYDFIILDTPPVGVVSDALVVSNYVDGILYLVRQNVTEKELVQRGIAQTSFREKILGFVLNGVGSDEDKYKYRQSAYKYSSYRDQIQKEAQSASEESEEA